MPRCSSPATNVVTWQLQVPHSTHMHTHRAQLPHAPPPTHDREWLVPCSISCMEGFLGDTPPHQVTMAISRCWGGGSKGQLCVCVGGCMCVDFGVSLAPMDPCALSQGAPCSWSPGTCRDHACHRRVQPLAQHVARSVGKQPTGPPPPAAPGLAPSVPEPPTLDACTHVCAHSKAPPVNTQAGEALPTHARLPSQPYTGARPHIHAHTGARTHAHTGKCTRMLPPTLACLGTRQRTHRHAHAHGSTHTLACRGTHRPAHADASAHDGSHILTHTHVNRHTQVHMYRSTLAHASTHTQAHSSGCIYRCVHTHTCLHTPEYASTHICIHAQEHSSMCIHATCSHTQAHTSMPAHPGAQNHIYMHTLTCLHTQACILTYAAEFTHINMLACTHMCKHTRGDSMGQVQVAVPLHPITLPCRPPQHGSTLETTSCPSALKVKALNSPVSPPPPMPPSHRRGN